MNIRLNLLTAFMIMCNVVSAGAIRDILIKEHALTQGRMSVAKKNGNDTKPYILKELALVGIYNSMEDEHALNEADAFSKCFQKASLLNEHMESKRDNDLYANALDEIKSLVINESKSK